MTLGKREKVETIQIMVWWHKPSVPPQTMIDIWQRHKAGFPCCKRLHALDGCMELDLDLPCGCLSPLILEIPVNHFVVSTGFLLCSLIPLYCTTFLYLEGNVFLENVPMIWKHGSSKPPENTISLLFSPTT